LPTAEGLQQREPRVRIVRTLCSLGLVASAVAAGAGAALADGKVLRVSLNTELQVLDPVVTTINATRVFAYLVFDTLVAIDNEGQYRPQMLEGWQVSDDRLTYTFKLRDGLLWSDGMPVTAEDCVESIKRWAKRESFGRQMMEAAQSLTAVDDKSFVLQLKVPFAFVIEALGKPGNTIPVMMPARLARLDPMKAVPEVIGSGPFVFRRKEWRPGDIAVFDRNPNYKPRPEPADGLAGGKVVKIDRVELVSMTDQSIRVAALQSGELDMIEVVSFDYLPALRADSNIAIGSQKGMQQTMEVLVINHRQPPFDKLKIRQALQASINQEEVLASLGGPPDTYMKCESIFMCDSPGTTAAGAEIYQTAGVERAKQLLKEGGYNNERVALLHAQTSLLLNAPNLVYADQMRKAGFNVDVLTSDFATVAQRRTSQAPVDQGGWSTMGIIWNGIDLVSPLSDPAVTNNCAQTYPGWYCDPEQTDLLKRYAVATNGDERKTLAAQLQAAFHKNVNMVLGGQFSAPPAYRADLKGLIPFAFPVFWNIERQ
jgi:peptide/nickel transport system substrate-binding protein